MAVVIPVIASFAAGAAGVAAVGAATTAVGLVAAYATVAGAVLSGIGAVTGKKDLIKIGGIMSLAGGVGTWATNASTASSAGVGQAADAAGGIDAAAESTAGAAVAAPAAETVAQPSLAEIANTPTGTDQLVPNLAGGAGQAAQPASLVPAAPANGLPMTAPGPNVPAPIQNYAQGLTMNDMQSFWDRLQGAGKSVGQFAQKNPELLKVGGQVATSMFGPQAEQAEQLRKQNEYQQSLMERSRANLNNPVRISYGGAKS